MACSSLVAGPIIGTMDEESARERAQELFQQAYQHQAKGELDQAVALYKESIAVFPTAEGYTFLGWTYSFMDRYDEAIAECRHAIEVDPDFGNPYNDIGSYLIQKGQLDEAIPWLEKATRAPGATRLAPFPTSIWAASTRPSGSIGRHCRTTSGPWGSSPITPSLCRRSAASRQ